jgi:hypothetical protein
MDERRAAEEDRLLASYIERLIIANAQRAAPTDAKR